MDSRALKRRLITVFFIFFMVAQFLISLPASFGLAGPLRPLTRIFETIGIKQRWSLFTHPRNDHAHEWSQIFFTVRVTDQNGAKREWVLPELPKGIYERYVRAREIDFMKTFWAVKSYAGVAFARAHAGMFLTEVPEARFPLQVEVLQTSERIRARLTPFEAGPYVAKIFELRIGESERRCSRRDSL